MEQFRRDSSHVAAAGGSPALLLQTPLSATLYFTRTLVTPISALHSLAIFLFLPLRLCAELSTKLCPKAQAHAVISVI
jgi:hypothetical protein